MKIRELVEFSVADSDAVERLESGGVRVRGVKLIGNRSRNRNSDGTHNVYPQETLEAARDKYEGAPIYHGHQRGSGERPPRDKVGQVESVESKDGGLYGNLLIAPGPDAERIAWAAESAPNFFAMSHHARGVGRKDGGDCRIEQIEEVRSVDLVCAGGTTRSLFEAETDESEGPMAVLENLTEEMLRKERPDLVKALLEAEKPAEGSGEEAATPEPKPVEAEESKGEQPDDEKPSEDSARVEALEAKLAQLEADKAAAEKKARRQQMLTESKLPRDRLGKAVVEQFYAVDEDEQAKALLEDLRRAYFHQVPVGAAPGGQDETQYSPDAFKAWIES